MKKVTYEFEVPDFCPEHCEAFSPFEFRHERLGCLNDTKCEQLYRRIKEMDERFTEERNGTAGSGDPALRGTEGKTC